MASFISIASSPIYGLPLPQHHGAQLEEPMPMDDDDSGYESEDYDFVRPSPVDPLHSNEGINRYDSPAQSRRQRSPRVIPLFRHVAPSTRHGRNPERASTIAGPGPGEGSHMHYHKHRSRIPAALPSLSNHIESDADDSSSSTSTRQSSADAQSRRHISLTTVPRSPAIPARTRDASSQTPSQDECEFRDRRLAAEWRKLYQESRKLEKQRAALMERQEVGRVSYRRDLTDRRWASRMRNMSVSDNGMDSEIVEAAGPSKRRGREGRSSRAK